LAVDPLNVDLIFAMTFGGHVSADSDGAEAGGARPSRFPDAPENIRRLPVDHRGFPVPYFVAWVNGKPDHRVFDPSKVEPAVRGDLCWICGEPLGEDKAFVIGPTSAFNRMTTEPASHWACGCFAASACPFLTQPRMRRNPKGLENVVLVEPGGTMQHSLDVSVVWATTSFTQTLHRDGRTLRFELGQPTRVSWFTEGRPASREEALASIEATAHRYRGLVEAGGQAAAKKLAEYRARVLALLPPPSEPA
jgi:hypothetical protein